MRAFLHFTILHTLNEPHIDVWGFCCSCFHFEGHQSTADASRIHTLAQCCRRTLTSLSRRRKISIQTKEKNNKLLQWNSPGCNRARPDYAPHVYRSRACICFCWRYLVKIFGIQRCIDCCCSTLFQLCLPFFGRRVDADFSRWLELNRFFHFIRLFRYCCCFSLFTFGLCLFGFSLNFLFSDSSQANLLRGQFTHYAAPWTIGEKWKHQKKKHNKKISSDSICFLLPKLTIQHNNNESESHFNNPAELLFASQESGSLSETIFQFVTLAQSNNCHTWPTGAHFNLDRFPCFSLGSDVIVQTLEKNVSIERWHRLDTVLLITFDCSLIHLLCVLCNQNKSATLYYFTWDSKGSGQRCTRWAPICIEEKIYITFRRNRRRRWWSKKNLK